MGGPASFSEAALGVSARLLSLIVLGEDSTWHSVPPVRMPTGPSLKPEHRIIGEQTKTKNRISLFKDTQAGQFTARHKQAMPLKQIRAHPDVSRCHRIHNFLALTLKFLNFASMFEDIVSKHSDYFLTYVIKLQSVCQCTKYPI